MSAYHHPIAAMHPVDAMHVRPPQIRGMRAFATAGLALWACDATRVTTPASCSPTNRGEKRRDSKWEVDSKAEVDAS
ncbi:MAG: hypothetical protein U0900_16090 [Myxococcota bacterium]